MPRQTLNAVQDRSTTLPTILLGRVKRSYSPTPHHVQTSACNDTNFLSSSRQDSELDAWARRATAASGFGDAPVSAATPNTTPDATEAAVFARAARSASLLEVIAVVTDALQSSARRFVAAWRRQRDENATYRALQSLDSRTLRDLGFDPSEMRSVASELTGGASRTRAHALLTLRNLAI
jgi:uncharacterized protein YjiS (DUF1127 family)